ncbi:hypothetical protein C7B61_08520 [filamentous cyanobacterium CCP1]|nr:hypothetical protein C7B76_24720 [filamentous cyanobacterium CCP2]PSB66987.1 hypothetical protein C7B61_08520 [filamentous cyanobacterium CCP1]
MNIEHLRKSLKAQWLIYYRDNRSWLTHLGVWVTCEGARRPSSSFILGTLSTLEPQLIQLLPLIVDLSSNPDRIVIALGLNFNPDEELKTFKEPEPPVSNGYMNAVKMLPEGSHTVEVAVQRTEQQKPEKQLEPVEVSQEAIDRPVPPEARPQQEKPLAEPTPPDAPKHPPQAQTPQQIVEPPNPAPIQPASAQSIRPRPAKPLTPNAQEPVDRPVQAVTSSSPVFKDRFPVVRPAMDSAELSAGELPNREVEEPNGKPLDERTPHSDR